MKFYVEKKKETDRYLLFLQYLDMQPLSSADICNGKWCMRVMSFDDCLAQIIPWKTKGYINDLKGL